MLVTLDSQVNAFYPINDVKFSLSLPLFCVQLVLSCILEMCAFFVIEDIKGEDLSLQ